MWIVYINGEETITAQGSIGDIQQHQNKRGNPKLISVYVEEIATIVQILNIFGPDLINSYLWFHILNFVSQRNLLPQRTLLEIYTVLRDNCRNNIYLCNMI